MSLHIRQKKNSSGTISIQIIDRANRKYKVIETIGCSKNEIELRFYLDIAKGRLEELKKKLYPNLLDILEEENKYKKQLNFINIYNNALIPIGDELIYGELFNQLGCNKLDLDYKEQILFKALVISRLLYPGSKLYLIDYMQYFKKEDIDKNKIYRFLDTLYKDEIKTKIEECVFKHTQKIMNNQIIVTFYDVTTLYFESESEDDFRRIGFSKEGKLARPQIQLGLFTTLEGYPLSYEVYEGNKYEGHTLIDILQKFQTKFNLQQKPIVVADRGMLTNKNIAFLENNNYKYILAYKIKNIDNKLKEQNGIKGFVTNDFTLKSKDVIEHYQNQYEVERAFRISKTDLRIRPIYHRLETRIKAHILISFVSYALYKEFERKLKLNDVKFNISQKLLRDIIKHMFAINHYGTLSYLKFDDIQQQVFDVIYS